ncbi:activator-dependent family glycosyltransferase [Kutzneria albida]|uniref:Glycosyltransferase n=1 Tax=Kutzneria albida DSM 43870 TaxID=1449976 RepID=W5WGR4_9PSEU|nr:activator-dependent family glycosyltransferase [Kutzneria albida]AHH99940.1 glycosyltransferase [Kutzneria albida DSM 43870]
MRVLFATLSEKSHVYALTPLAWAFTTAGHEVRVASTPDMAPVIAGTGLSAVAVGENHNMHEILLELQGAGLLESEEADWSRPFAQDLTWEQVHAKVERSILALGNYNDPMVDDLVRFARAWKPDLVVWDVLTYSGGIAAQACGAANARFTWSLDLYSPMRKAFLELRGAREVDPMADWFGGHLERFDCEYDEDLLHGRWTVDMVPSSLQLPVTGQRVPVRYTPYNGPSVVPDWVLEAPERPRVCLTPGVSFTGDGSYLPIRTVMESLADLDIEVVATMSPEDMDPATVPANTRLTGFVPLHALLPTCSAVINHGGFGTRSTAMYYGVPQYLLPIRHGDVLVYSEALDRVSAGLYSHASEVTAEKIRDGVVRLLGEPGFAQSANRLRQEILTTPSPNEVVPLLERLTIQHRTSVPV